ncbi:MAG: hypothetical protein R2854_04070 [Caldilineaceae bacterium]
MNTPALDIVIIGLSITSSWGNGHATTYRALVHALAKRGHQILFLERDRPWYARNRDMPQPPFGRTVLYTSLDELFNDYSERGARGSGGGRLLCAGRRRRGPLGAGHGHRLGHVLRHRHAGDHGQAGPRRLRVHHAGPDLPV